jgi:hypothetical protein
MGMLSAISIGKNEDSPTNGMFFSPYGFALNFQSQLFSTIP